MLVMRWVKRAMLAAVSVVGLILLAWALAGPRSRPAAGGRAATPPRRPDAQTGEFVEILMTACEQGRPMGWRDRCYSGGWRMTLPDGTELNRDGLQMLFAAPVIRLGPDAVPHLFKWVMHENLAVRYVAAYSLEQITGVPSHIFWFDREDAEHHREQAIARWRGWWETEARPGRRVGEGPGTALR
jgi:hypothetical protein